MRHYPVELQQDGSVFFPHEVREYFMGKNHHKPKIYILPNTSAKTKKTYLVCLRHPDDLDWLRAHYTSVLWPSFESRYEDKNTGKAILYSTIKMLTPPSIKELNDSGNFRIGETCRTAGLSGKLTWAIHDQAPVQGITHWLELWQYDKFCEEYKNELLSLDDPKTLRMIKSIFNGLA